MNSQEKLITIEKIFLDIGKQMLETNNILSLGQLLKIILELKRYLWQKLKPKKTYNVSKTTIEKQVGSSIPEVRTIAIAIDNHMVIIQVQIGNNTIEDVLLSGGSGINIITEQLRLRLGLPKPKLVPYNLRMVNQTTIKPVGLIKDLKIYVHGILYIIMFIVLQNRVVDSNYSMLLGRPWLRDAKTAHDWGVTLLPYKGMGQSEQLKSPNIWEVK